MTDQFAVLGNPIKHSLSPHIHQQFAQHHNHQIDYGKIEAPLDDFKQTVAKLHQQGYSGLNVTLPFKLEAHALAESLSERATLAGAANTLIRTEQGWRGDNTDGIGLISDLEAVLGDGLRDLHILILGAGGSVQGILPALQEQQPASIHIANRTMAKAEELVRHYQDDTLTASGLDYKFPQMYDLMINATAASLDGEAPALSHTPLISSACYDLFYAASPTAFMQWGKTIYGAKVKSSDGLGMLVRQAAASYELWTDTYISDELVDSIQSELRKQLAG